MPTKFLYRIIDSICDISIDLIILFVKFRVGAIKRLIKHFYFACSLRKGRSVAAVKQKQQQQR